MANLKQYIAIIFSAIGLLVFVFGAAAVILSAVLHFPKLEFKSAWAALAGLLLLVLSMYWLNPRGYRQWWMFGIYAVALMTLLVPLLVLKLAVKHSEMVSRSVIEVGLICTAISVPCWWWLWRQGFFKRRKKTAPSTSPH